MGKFFVRNARGKRKKERKSGKETFEKTSFSLLSNLFPHFFVAPVIVFRKLGDVISFPLASYINVGEEPSKTALKQMAMRVNARK